MNQLPTPHLAPSRSILQLLALGVLGAALAGCAPAPAALAPVKVKAAMALTLAPTIPQALDLVVRTPAGPAAGYVVTIANAFTGTSLPRAAEPTPARATIIAAAVPETDAQGRLSLLLTGVAPGTMLRIVAAGEGQVLQAEVPFEPAGLVEVDLGSSERPSLTPRAFFGSAIEPETGAR